MTDSVIWTITDEDAATAEQQEHNEAMAAVADAWEREADLLATAYNALAAKLPKPLAHDITLLYARKLLLHDTDDPVTENDGTGFYER